MRKDQAERKKRGMTMLIVGLGLIATRLAGLDQIFMISGIIFALLGCGDLFFDSRYKRRFK